MELIKFEDFIKSFLMSQSQKVWYVRDPYITKEKITDSYHFDCPFESGFLKLIGHISDKLIIIFESEDYKHSLCPPFIIDKENNSDLKGKIFTTEEEARKYWKEEIELYSSKINELNKKYTIKMSDICEKFGFSKDDMDKIIIKMFE